jgi:hypothetical protein
LAKENVTGIFSAEDCLYSLLERSLKQYGWPGVLFLPAVEISIGAPTGASQILAELCVAVDHQVTCE